MEKLRRNYLKPSLILHGSLIEITRNHDDDDDDPCSPGQANGKCPSSQDANGSCGLNRGHGGSCGLS